MCLRSALCLHYFFTTLLNINEGHVKIKRSNTTRRETIKIHAFGALPAPPQYFCQNCRYFMRLFRTEIKDRLLISFETLRAANNHSLLPLLVQKSGTSSALFIPRPVLIFNKQGMKFLCHLMRTVLGTYKILKRLLNLPSHWSGNNYILRSLLSV